MSADYYKILNVPRIATTSEIKSRYKFLAKKYHPDYSGDTATMSQINKAYSILSNPRLRFEYNQSLKASHHQPSYFNSAMDYSTAGTQPVQKQTPRSHAPLIFHPFRSVGIIVFLVIGLTLLGLLGLVRDIGTMPLDTSGSASTAGSQSVPQSTHSSGQAAVKPKNVLAPSNQSSLNTSTPLTNKKSGMNVFGTTVAHIQQDFKTEKAQVQSCESAVSQFSQSVLGIENQINIAQKQLMNLTEGESDTINNLPEAGQSDYTAQIIQLEQHLQQYNAELSALNASHEMC